MNKIFNIHRLLITLRWDLLAYWKKYVRNVLGLAFAFAFICIVHQYNWHENTPEAQMQLTDVYLSNISGTFFCVAFLLFLVCGASIFNNMRTKQSRATFLMLPASNLEKFVSRFLWVTVGCLVMLLASLVITDVIQYVFSWFITPHMHGSLTASFFEEIFCSKSLDSSSDAIVVNHHSVMSNYFPKWALMFSVLAYCHSFFTLGGSIFRKYTVILTVVSSFVLMFLLTIVFNLIGSDTVVYFIKDLGPYNIGYVMIVLCIILSVFNYWLSYKLFTRMQVINNKWLN